MQLSVSYNEEKKGVEARFDDKPSDQLTDLLGKMGFKYSYRQTMWYAGDTHQRRAFLDGLKVNLEQDGDLENIIINPAYKPSLDNINDRNFSCVTITCQHDEDETIEEYLLCEPSKRIAEEIARRFADAVFGDTCKRISVHPRNRKKQARSLYEQGRIIYSSVPENHTAKEDQEANLQPEIISTQTIDLADDVPIGDDLNVQNALSVESPVAKPNAYSEVIAQQLEQPIPLIEEAPTLAKKELTDEAILEELFNMNRIDHLSRSLLKELGIQHPLDDWQIPIGKYQLTRTAVFKYTYKLTKLTTED
ncbi:hypothetical protein [Flavilitoribacter nigricans]|uniref:Uncharacterized protein n=1 Tax=Flavilitoribacter nigricans (strain ATCC 23147 / DSM 23189 / NBRC 102662 / NCIMB 1420 / SS-2) TaxID=1122177 RepID=A0A2D0NJS8_FLAN2|nr:hypothetical protein [Flavilitoribacter nigricans]PHN08688.1 hypothetical protein CRP01_01895 [Flavilitoribacter nigricans DSM 23189 = NBRC 102662]